jgi:hypothetical protein
LLSTQASGRFVQGGAALKGINLAVFTINVDGTGIGRLTPWGIHAVEGDWSPDGTRSWSALSWSISGTPAG